MLQIKGLSLFKYFLPSIYVSGCQKIVSETNWLECNRTSDVFGDVNVSV